MSDSSDGPPRGRLLANRRTSLLAGVVGLILGAAAVALAMGQGGTLFGHRAGADPGREQVEQIVHDYVLAHPDIIPEAMQRLQERETAKVVAANRAQFETPFAGAWSGAKDGDVTLVEFFDYACTFCRASNADVDRLLKEDPRLRVVWRDWPVLGEDSHKAAQLSLAAAAQGKFREFHDRMFALGRPTADTRAAVQVALGIGAAPASPLYAAEIRKNYELAHAINATGTPAFIVGDRVFSGAVGYDVLKAAIAEARGG